MFQFILNAILFGLGLAMDAFSVSLANGLHDTKMRPSKMSLIAGAFAIFQAIMPLIGWFFVTTLVDVFTAFEKLIPYVSLILLCYIGGKMLYEGFAPCESDENLECTKSLTFGALIVQAIATSIDALSVGFTISNLDFSAALLEAVIIAAVTFPICYAGIVIGKKFGTKLSGKASIFGGAILVAIGFEIFISSVFFS